MKQTAATFRTRLLAWPALSLAAIAITLVLAGSPVASAVKAGFLLCAMASPVAVLFGPQRTCLDFPFFAVAASVGLVLTGCLATLAMAVNYPPEAAIVIYLCCGLVICVVCVLTTRRDNQTADIDSAIYPKWELSAAAVVVSFTLISIMLVYDYRMGSGPFPAVFYGVDNPYHLAIVRSMIASDQFPPNSLNFVGEMGAYHYAMLAAAAMVSRISGLTAHTSFFLLGSGVLTVGTIALCWLIARSMVRGWLSLVVMALLYLGTFHQNVLKFVQGIVPSLRLLVVGGADQAVTVTMKFGHVITQAGMLFALLAAYLMIFRREKWAKILLVLIIGLAPPVKVLHFIALIVWLGVITLIEFLREAPWKRPWKSKARIAIQHFWPTVTAFVLGLIVMRIEGFQDGHRRLVFAFFADADVNEDIFATLQHASILFVPAALSVLATRGRYLKYKSLLAAALALSPLVLISITALSITDVDSTDSNWAQVAAPATIGLTLCVALLLADSWPALERKGRLLVGLAIAVCMGTQFFRFPITAIDVALHEGHGYEVNENGDIAQALHVIPLDGLIVTNDVRNPAEDYKRVNLQTQIAGIFGHHCFLCTAAYDHLVVPDLDNRLSAQDLLKSEHWQPAIVASAKQYGWSYFLVHKAAAHPEDIPLALVYDSPDYAVYRF